MLLYFDRHPRCEVCEITSALCIPTVSAVQTVQTMQKNEWIRKPQVHARMKTVKLQLTEKGVALAQEVKENIDVTDQLFALANSQKAA